MKTHGTLLGPDSNSSVSRPLVFVDIEGPTHTAALRWRCYTRGGSCMVRLEINCAQYGAKRNHATHRHSPPTDPLGPPLEPGTLEDIKTASAAIPADKGEALVDSLAIMWNLGAE